MAERSIFAGFPDLESGIFLAQYHPLAETELKKINQIGPAVLDEIDYMQFHENFAFRICLKSTIKF